MGRGSRHNAAASAASLDILAALRPSGGVGWVDRMAIATAAASIDAGDYSLVDTVIARLKQGTPLQRDLPAALYEDCARALAGRLQADDADAAAPALAYAKALRAHRRQSGETHPLLDELGRSAARRFTAQKTSPRHVLPSVLWNVGDTVSPTASDKLDDVATTFARHAGASLADNPPADLAEAELIARRYITGGYAAWMRDRIDKTPVIYGVIIRAKPNARTPTIEQIREALHVAVAAADTLDATEAFRVALADADRGV